MGARVQQHQIQKLFKFTEQLCPQFSEHRTLDAATWKKVGIKIQQHYYNYESESVSADMLHFWMLIQKRLDLNPKQQEILPSEPVRREMRPPTPLEELLDEFIKLSVYNQSEPND